jgi:molybdopterin converting factor small subunit
MPIEVRVPTVLRKHTDGQKTVTGDGATLRELVADLESSNSGLGAALVSDDGSLHRFINVYVNDEDVRYLGGIETPLTDGDTVSILPAVAGGAG